MCSKMHPTKWCSPRKSKRLEMKEERRSAGKPKEFFEESETPQEVDRLQVKMNEVRRKMFETKIETKSKWWFCENCFQFTRERDRPGDCDEEHTRTDTRTLKVVYNIDNTRTMRDYLLAVRRDLLKSRDVDEEVPLIGRKTMKKIGLYRRKEVARATEE